MLYVIAPTNIADKLAKIKKIVPLFISLMFRFYAACFFVFLVRG